MTYTDTIEYLFTRLPMYQKVGKKAFKKDLTNTLKLLETLGNPHQKFKSVHIAGTNGKGTSAHAIASILQTAGYKTGLYTSPHLKSFTERIKINGAEVEEDFVVNFVNKLQEVIEQVEPSFFEITVAMAYEYFANQQVDIAIIETGLGGRLDSTNVIVPEVALITNIGFDHMDLLGDTLAKIAAEKAGIIKQGIPTVIGEALPETRPVFEQYSKDKDAPLFFAGNCEWRPESLVPKYLIKNLGGVEAVIQQLQKQGWKVSSDDIRTGINQINEQTGLKGRLQVLSDQPLTLVDVSHNQDGIKVLFDQVNELNKGKIHLIFGTVKDKNLEPLFELFPANVKCYWTEASVPRALSLEELAIQAVMKGITGDCYKDVNEALRVASSQAQSNDLILVTGSTFVVAEIANL